MGSPVAPTGLDHVTVHVPDAVAALAFYTEKLGLREDLGRPDFGVAGSWLSTAGGPQVHLIEGAVPENVGQHFALSYDDLAVAVAALRDQGLEVTEPREVASTGRRQAFTADPWGNRIELHQRA